MLFEILYYTTIEVHLNPIYRVFSSDQFHMDRMTGDPRMDPMDRTGRGGMGPGGMGGTMAGGPAGTGPMDHHRSTNMSGAMGPAGPGGMGGGMSTRGIQLSK